MELPEAVLDALVQRVHGPRLRTGHGFHGVSLQSGGVARHLHDRLCGPLFDLVQGVVPALRDDGRRRRGQPVRFGFHALRHFALEIDDALIGPLHQFPGFPGLGRRQFRRDLRGRFSAASAFSAAAFTCPMLACADCAWLCAASRRRTPAPHTWQLRT